MQGRCGFPCKVPLFAKCQNIELAKVVERYLGQRNLGGVATAASATLAIPGGLRLYVSAFHFHIISFLLTIHVPNIAHFVGGGSSS